MNRNEESSLPGITSVPGISRHDSEQLYLFLLLFESLFNSARERPILSAILKSNRQIRRIRPTILVHLKRGLLV